MDDEQIITLYFDRSEAAITETDRKYGRLCYQVADNILRSQRDSEECVSDSYLGVWNAIPPTRPSSFRGFLCGIVRNISLMRLRHNMAQKRSRELEISLSELEGILPDEHISIGTDEDGIADAISEFLWKTPVDQRNIFIRKYFFFDTVSDIAERFGFSESKVKTTLHRTREKLREHLAERGIRV